MPRKGASRGSSPGNYYMALVAIKELSDSLLKTIAESSGNPTSLDGKAQFREEIQHRSYLYPELQSLRAVLFSWIEVLDDEIDQRGA
jgi:hypothetical protein